MGAPNAGGKVQFFPGQKNQSGRLFEAGGIFDQILAGGPNIRTEMAGARGMQQVQRSFASRGQEGSGLEARAVSDAAFKGNVQREGAQLEQLLAFIQPAGAGSNVKGFFAQEFGK